MHAWAEEACQSGYIKQISRESLKHGVFCTAASNPWYDSSVSFDWTELHKRVKNTTSTKNDTVSSAIEKLLAFGHAQLDRCGADNCVMTTIEVSQPWRMQPLATQAQEWSVFSVKKEPTSSSPPQSADAEFNLYAFQQGPPGQRSVRDDILQVLGSVEKQLRDANVCVINHLSSFLIFSGDFNHLLQQTAAVHKALKSAGLSINAQGSCFAPRRVLVCDARPWWTVFPLASLRSPDDIALFAVDMFFQWLQDDYEWRCHAPVQVFPTRPPGGATSGDASKAAPVLSAERLALFERFIRSVVLPQAVRVGFEQLKDMLPEEGGDLLELAAPNIEKKRVLVGPQKWSIADVRLALYHLGAAEKDVHTVLGS